MEMKIAQNSAEWDDVDLTFAQSWEWGEILRKEGKKVERLGFFEGDLLVASAQLVYSPLIFSWQYICCPKGPVFHEARAMKNETQEKALSALFDYCKNKNAAFLRVEPNFDITRYALHATRKTIDVNPRATLILDLTKSEEELLQNMHAKTRYNIHLAERKNLRGVWEKNSDVFLSLMEETGKRDSFRLHNENHYQEILNSNMSKQITIYFENVPTAVGVFIASGNYFTYLYGASSWEHRNLMAPYLVQWLGIMKGKELGYEWYDFFGVAPLKKENDGQFSYNTKHQYAGVTRFKLGFGGEPNESLGTLDIIVDRKKYWVYQILRGVRRLF
ncbi:aminoacyltransferase [Patescibacteria group bacterium]|nr:aminoacyltransferase [Patescibacteria group bacterium]